MDVSVIIVNWNSADFVRKCITSIWRETPDLRYEIIVVDSASYDGCGEMLGREFAGVRFIQSEKNVGFARANNLGFEQSQGDYVLFLNPDTELVGPAINVLHRALMELPDAGIVGAKLLNTDLTLQTECVQAFPTILNQLLDAEVLRRAFPRHPLWGMAPLFAAERKPAVVQVVCGASMMMRRSAFERIGRFSEDYFMYSEDADLCYKAQKSGYKNYYVPEATIMHYDGGSTAKTSFNKLSNVMLKESRWRFLSKSKGAGYAALYRLTIAIAAIFRLAAIAVIWLLGNMAGKTGAVSEQFKKWLAIFRWTIGLESKVRKPMD